MTDPYKVLGVSPSASDEQIKQVYRELARKYHPDNYINNPLAELATEKMKEINTAYDQIREQRSRSSSASQGSSYQQANRSYGSYSGGSSQFADIRRLLQNGMISQALELLEGVPVSSRDGEWYFLKGTVFYNRGWLDEAHRHFRQAVELDPTNAEYQRALNQILQQRQQGYTQGTPYVTTASCCGPCSLCTTLICADCTCSAFRCCF